MMMTIMIVIIIIIVFITRCYQILLWEEKPSQKISSPLTCGFAVQLAVVPINHLEEAGSNRVKA